MGYIDEACEAGARLRACCKVVGISIRTLQRWRTSKTGDDMRMGPKSKPANALSKKEEEEVLAMLNSPEFRELSPKQIVPILADKEVYMASESTMERLMHREGQRKHRGPKRCRSNSKPREKSATEACKLWTWDITCLPKEDVVGQFYYLYMAVDVWSRKVVAATVFERECSELASEWMIDAMRGEGLAPSDLLLHSDNGSPMKGTLKVKLESLNVLMSYSRPHVSNDNPYSESLFGTMKTRPRYPGRFASLAAAKLWCEEFVTWYNDEHKHSAIGYVTPNQRHNGEAIDILAKRRLVFEAARSKRPERWSGKVRKWDAPERVYLNPDKETLEELRKRN